MILIDGKKEAALLREELKKEVSELKVKYNKVPGLTVILIGDLTPSQIYVRNKEKSANEVGLKSDVIKYPDSVEEKVVLEKIEELNNDPLDGFDQMNLIFWLLILLLILDSSADFDGWRKLINRKEKNITFFEIPEINLKI